MYKIVLFVFIVFPTCYGHAYFKNVIDISENIIIVKVINVNVVNIENRVKGDAKVIKVLKGNIDKKQIKLKSISILYHSYSTFKNGELAILFLRKTKNNNTYTIYSWSILHTLKIKNDRFVSIWDEIIFPYRISKNIYTSIDTIGKAIYVKKYIPFDTLVNTISELIYEPPLLYRKDCYFLCGKYLASRSYSDLDKYIKDNPNLTDVDRIAIYGLKFNTGVSSDVVKYLIGEPKNVIKIDKDKEKWKYKGLADMFFSLPDRKLILINQ
jgi:hypothetical protein